MAKKSQIINHYHIEELEVETKIDYQKLAEAIVAAQEEAKKNEKRPNRFRASIMAAANMIAPILLTIFSVLTCIGMWTEFAKEPAFEVSTYIGFTVLFAAITVVSICCGIEAWKDDDENVIMHFNTNVALVALIVSLVALIKG